MNISMNYRIFNYVLLLLSLGGVIMTGCKDRYLDPYITNQDQSAAQLQQAFPNRALVFAVKSGQINVNPYKCRPFDDMVCLTYVPKLEVPRAFVKEFIDIPIDPDPCPWSISCPPFIPIITQLVDLKGNPIPMEEWDADPLMVEGDFLFIQINNPQEDALLSGEPYSISKPVVLDASWTKHLGLDGNVISEGVYFTQYNEAYKSTTMAVPLKNIGHFKP